MEEMIAFKILEVVIQIIFRYLLGRIIASNKGNEFVVSETSLGSALLAVDHEDFSRIVVTFTFSSCGYL